MFGDEPRDSETGTLTFSICLFCHACFSMAQCYRVIALILVNIVPSWDIKGPELVNVRRYPDEGQYHFCRTCFSMGDLGVQVSVHPSVCPSVPTSVYICG